MEYWRASPHNDLTRRWLCALGCRPRDGARTARNDEAEADFKTLGTLEEPALVEAADAALARGRPIAFLSARRKRYQHLVLLNRRKPNSASNGVAAVDHDLVI